MNVNASKNGISQILRKLYSVGSNNCTYLAVQDGGGMS